MAHIIHKIGGDTTAAVALVTITNYTQGGESFTLAEFGLSGTLFRLWIIPSTGLGSESLPRAEYMGAGVVKLFNGAEIATTTGVNLQCLVAVTVGV